ncbi:acetolactate decarboxylase [Klebsiella pneumoniae]|nr:acetolactate decarboxylase [Klebsiella pneumoniae]
MLKHGDFGLGTFNERWTGS